MSGNQKGAEPTLTIKNKKPPTYDPMDPKKKIRKESDINANVGNPQTTTVKLAFRIKAAQGLSEFKILRPNSTELHYSDPPGGDLPGILAELKDVFGTASDEQWIVKYLDYDKNFGTKFSTKFELNPFGVHPNGLQVVPVVFTHKDRSFADDNYVFGTSILPGQNNSGISLSTALATLKKKPAMKKAAKKTAAKKTAKKKRKK
jgi:hypothetical protein